MINYETASLKDLFKELQETKIQLTERLKGIEELYKNTLKKVSENKDAVRLLKGSYSGDDLNVTLTDSVDTIKIIDNIILDKIINKFYVEQLKKKASNNTRRKRLGDFKEEWLEKIFGGNNQDYEKLYIDFCHIDDWIDDCRNIAYCLTGFIGERNPLIEDLNLDKITKEKTEIKGIDNSSEEIYLKTLGIKIKGDCIAKGTMNLKKVFNPTEKALIYFLFFRFLKNKDECFTTASLAKELKKSEGYIKNSLTDIYKIIRKTMSQVNTSIKWEPLIKNESRRGYHLNPRLFLEVTKK